MTTTIDPLVVQQPKIHRRGVAFAIAATLIVGSAAAATAVIVADDGHSAPAPAHVTTKNGPLEDPLVSRFRHHLGENSNATPKPLLRLSGPR
jgi:hypothetical protein